MTFSLYVVKFMHLDPSASEKIPILQCHIESKFKILAYTRYIFVFLRLIFRCHRPLIFEKTSKGQKIFAERQHNLLWYKLLCDFDCSLGY